MFWSLLGPSTKLTNASNLTNILYTYQRSLPQNLNQIKHQTKKIQDNEVGPMQVTLRSQVTTQMNLEELFGSLREF